MHNQFQNTIVVNSFKCVSIFVSDPNRWSDQQFTGRRTETFEWWVWHITGRVGQSCQTHHRLLHKGCHLCTFVSINAGDTVVVSALSGGHVIFLMLTSAVYLDHHQVLCEVLLQALAIMTLYFPRSQISFNSSVQDHQGFYFIADPCFFSHQTFPLSQDV